MLRKIKEYLDRPPCPECGSRCIWSNGANWLCVDCGKKFSKFKRRLKKKLFKNRPRCRECGKFRCTPRPGINRWKCLECGKEFTIMEGF